MDLARNILFEIEKQEPYTGTDLHIEIEGAREEDYVYHVMILKEAGLIEAFEFSAGGMIDWRPKRLTWQGHDFLDAARNDATWRKANELVKEKGGAMTFEILKALLVQFAKETLGLAP